MSPPSLAIAALGCWQIGAAMLLRVSVNRWLHRPVVWAFVVRVNTVIMTLFLWHLTAFVIAIIVLYPLGFGEPVEPTLRWWAERFVWIAAPALILSILVLTFGRFEQPTPTKPRP